MKNKKHIIIPLILFGMSLLILVAMFSYSPYDISFDTSSPNLHIRNYIGPVGAYISWVLFKVIGRGAFLIPFLCIILGVGFLIGRLEQKKIHRFLGITLLFLSFSSFLSITGIKDSILMVERGGIIGFFFSNLLVEYFGIVGTYIITITLSALTIIAVTEFLVIHFISFLGIKAWQIILKLKDIKLKREEKPRKVKGKAPETPRLKPAVRVEKRTPHLRVGKEQDGEDYKRKPVEKPVEKPKIVFQKPKPSPPKPIKVEPKIVGDYKMPSIDLLNPAPSSSEKVLESDLEASGRILEDTLQDFNIDAKVVNITKGPVITRYELQPAPGVKVNKITTLSDDIALNMKATTVRIVAPIPGKQAIGIEVPNQDTSLVCLREILESKEYQKKAASSKLTMALGKDISGRSVVTDLGDMPHLLIAGTTGSGKTVCVNSIIMSMIYNAAPDELKFIMVDPKMVELAIYNGLPHLLCPVVTDSKKASGALHWVVNEMESRYKLLAKEAARNINIYNKKVEKKLPYIVVVIDELADLMMVAQQDVENAITRLAQLSRAVGIHIILATQRPSVDVVTGVIKANFPARISFKVASKVDSRTVLDVNGADKLLGKGDMLFLEPGSPKPVRAQGTLLTDQEIEKVVNVVKEQRDPVYEDKILEEQKKSISGKASMGKDEFFDEAVKMVIDTGQASVSMLQRRLRLGYTRAARLIDAMEEQGIVGPFQGSKPREILISEYKSEG